MNTVKFAQLISYITTIRTSASELSVSDVEYIHGAINNMQEDRPVDVNAVHRLIGHMASERKIDAIKEHRSITGYGLKESKDAVESVMNKFHHKVDVTDDPLYNKLRNGKANLDDMEKAADWIKRLAEGN